MVYLKMLSFSSQRRERSELGVALRGQGFVKALASASGVAGDLRHALCMGDIAQRCRYERRIAFLECGLKMRRDIFLGSVQPRINACASCAMGFTMMQRAAPTKTMIFAQVALSL